MTKLEEVANVSYSKTHPPTYEEKLHSIILFALDKPWFDGEMYEDILNQYERTGYLSDAQMIAIDNVIEGFNIH